MTEGVKVVVDGNGNPKSVEFVGYKGDACFAAANAMAERLRALGIDFAYDVVAVKDEAREANAASMAARVRQEE